MPNLARSIKTDLVCPLVRKPGILCIQAPPVDHGKGGIPKWGMVRKSESDSSESKAGLRRIRLAAGFSLYAQMARRGRICILGNN
jgi:hypothetical protein